jgi:sporulation protein YlmC with PRC-barrel domain
LNSAGEDCGCCEQIDLEQTETSANHSHSQPSPFPNNFISEKIFRKDISTREAPFSSFVGNHCRRRRSTECGPSFYIAAWRRHKMSSNVVGVDIYDTSDNDIGKIQDVGLDSSKTVKAHLVSVGWRPQISARRNRYLFAVGFDHITHGTP